MYVKKENESVIAWNGPSLGRTAMLEAGWILYTGTLPTSRLDIVDGAVIELPEPGPTVEQVAAQTRDELTLRAAMLVIPIEDDKTALALSPVCPEWAAGTHYEAGEIVNHEGQAYRVVQPVDSLEHQPPGAEGMLAIYRPLNTENTGTVDDPIPYVYGMDVYNGKYYSFNGKTYLAKSDMTPCVWDPGTPGLWQWEEVTDDGVQ